MKARNLIVCKMSTTETGTRLYWDGAQFRSTYQVGGVIGMIPKMVNVKEYIALRNSDPKLFEDSALLNKNEHCKYSIAMCKDMI